MRGVLTVSEGSVITAKSHDVSKILDPTFTPGPSPEEKELFEAKTSIHV